MRVLKYTLAASQEKLCEKSTSPAHGLVCPATESPQANTLEEIGSQLKNHYASRYFFTRPIQLLVLLFCFCLPSSPALADEWHFSGVKRIVALSDIHGAYDALVATFQEAGVIDNSLAWNGAETHVVITGDLLDRGPESRRVMDLIMRLEREAPLAGGQMHLLLGNHEVMNLIGDLRYVSVPEYAAFSDEESAQEREQWYQQFRRSQPADADELTVRAEFDEKAPPGFFGHRHAFRNDGTYGKWLLEKPLMIVINDTAFVHGGVPPYVAEHGLAGVNGALKIDLFNFLAALSTLEDAGILSPLDWFRDQPSILTAKMEAGQLDDALMTSAQVVVDHRSSPINTSDGPLWYRGSSICNGLIEGDGLNTALSRIGATRAAIGHTTTVTRRVQQRMNGRIIEINTGMLKSSYQGRGYALIIEGDTLSIVSEDGETDLSPIVPPRRVGYRSGGIDDDALTNILANGTITIVDSNADEAMWQLVRVVAADKTVFAYFNALARKQRFVPELAAYRLDRLLGLNMVPVTVPREVAGQHGTLQFVPVDTLTERQRVVEEKGADAPCSLVKQRSAMYIYDALIHNPLRTPLSMLYSPNIWQLMLINHQNSFGTKKDRPTYLKNIKLEIGDQWRTALLELDDQTLLTNLGDVLDKHRLAALSKRRDALIEDSNRLALGMGSISR